MFHWKRNFLCSPSNKASKHIKCFLELLICSIGSLFLSPKSVLHVILLYTYMNRFYAYKKLYNVLGFLFVRTNLHTILTVYQKEAKEEKRKEKKETRQ